MYLSEIDIMFDFKDIVDAIVDVRVDPTQAAIHVHHGSIFPVVDYRLDGNILHLINFRSNDLIEDVVTVQELVDYIDTEGFDLQTVKLDCKDFEIVEDRVLLY